MTKRRLKTIRLADVVSGDWYCSRTQLILSTKVNPIDIGAFSYRDHKHERIGAKWITSVENNKLDRTRVKRLRAWIDNVAIAHSGGASDTTIAGQIKAIRKYIKFCDKNGNHNFLKNKLEARAAFRNYTTFLNSRIRDNELDHGTAGREQACIAVFIERCFDLSNESVLIGINKIKRSANTYVTEVSDAEEINANIHYLKRIFLDIAKFTINNDKYPAKLDLGLGGQWIFPTRRWMKLPRAINDNNIYAAYDYDNGVIRPCCEIENHYKHKHIARKAIDNANKLIERANGDSRYHTRLTLAVWSHDSFVMLFIAITGMNLSGARNLIWNDDYVIERDIAHFSTIKYRAMGKKCEFTIQSVFMPYFRTFLKLRRFLIGDDQCNWLFFSRNSKSTKKYSRIPVSFSTCFSTKFNQQIDSELKVITAMEWRANKGDYLLRSTDIATTALVLQNKESTVKKYYSNGSAKVALDEMTEFFDRGMPLRKRSSSNSDEIPVGACSEFGNPLSINNMPIVADCRKWEGCLDCKNYGVHADKLDVWKLLSAKEVVLATRYSSISKTDFDNRFEYFLNRVEEIVVSISNISSEHNMMVTDTRKKVKNGEFYSYWLNKYEMFVSLGVIVE